MTADIYDRARRTSGQGIDDQIPACRKRAKLRSLSVSDEHI